MLLKDKLYLFMYPGFLFVFQNKVEKQDVILYLKKVSNEILLVRLDYREFSQQKGILSIFAAQKPVTSEQPC